MKRQRERERVGGKPNDFDVYDCLFIENAKKNKDLICQPIYEWTDTDVWDFIREKNLKYNPLYDCGFRRVGCIGCPMSSTQTRELDRYPRYKKAYIQAFQKMVEERKRRGKVLDEKYSKLWKDGESTYLWWIEDKTIPGQTKLDLGMDDKE